MDVASKSRLLTYYLLQIYRITAFIAPLNKRRNYIFFFFFVIQASFIYPGGGILCSVFISSDGYNLNNFLK